MSEKWKANLWTLAPFTPFRFIRLYLGVNTAGLGFCCIAYFLNPIEWTTPDLAMIPAFGYLVSVWAWAVAYSAYCNFPKRFELLLLGIVVSGALLTNLFWRDGIYGAKMFDSVTPSAVIGSVAIGWIGAAFQLLGLTLGFHLFKYMFRLFGRKTT